MRQVILCYEADYEKSVGRLAYVTDEAFGIVVRDETTSRCMAHEIPLSSLRAYRMGWAWHLKGIAKGMIGLAAAAIFLPLCFLGVDFRVGQDMITVHAGIFGALGMTGLMYCLFDLTTCRAVRFRFQTADAVYTYLCEPEMRVDYEKKRTAIEAILKGRVAGRRKA